MAISEPYLTNTEADSILSVEQEPWINHTPAEKTEALEWAKLYMDSVYVFNGWSTTPDEVLLANALLANYNLTKNLFTGQDSDFNLTEKTVKAGPVTTTKKFDVHRKGAVIDLYPEITGLLTNVLSSVKIGKNYSGISR